ncbi:MAG: Crp/Fnr family transcriptional regulator [Cyclobacteriaceae bacterium]|nr:Crp/Fnr family transcriptional regulator [Cyclobacteriaceae bacterium]
MSFIDFYNSLLQENASSYDELPYLVSKNVYKKNTVLTKYGDVEQHVYFINQGVIELKIKSYTSEKFLDFYFPGEITTSYTSFLSQTPSDVEMITLTDCELEVISYESIQAAYQISLKANQFGRILTEHAYMQKAQREKDLLSKTAEERYAELLELHKEYIAKIPVSKLAGYLGIHPESLSRIRKKMNS